MLESTSDLLVRLRDDDTPLHDLSIDAATAIRDLHIQLYPESSRTLTGRWVICYLRISDDREDDRRGVRTQSIDTIIHAFAAGAAGVTIAEENDTSAYKTKRVTVTDSEGDTYFVWRVIRPVWQESLRALRKGEKATGMVVGNLDRLARDPRDLEDAIELVVHYDRPVISATGSLDLTTDNGRTMARILVAMGNQASADTSRRVKRAHKRRREAGKPVGGVRPFGWEKDRLTLHPQESMELRTAREKLIAGVAPSAILMDWRARDVKTPRGFFWQHAGLLMMMRNPRIVGLAAQFIVETRENGATWNRWKIAKRADGSEIHGLWQPIFTRVEWEELLAVIGAETPPSRRYQANTRPITYLLAGILRCGNCEKQTRMTGETRRDANNVYRYYRCQSRPAGGCVMRGGNMDQVDALVTALAFRLHDSKAGDLLESVAVDLNAEVDAKLADIEEQLNELHAEWKAKRTKTATYLALREELEQEQEELRKQRRQAAPRVPRPVLESVRDRWETASIPEKNAFIGQYLKAVVVHPSTRFGWEPERYEPVAA